MTETWEQGYWNLLQDFNGCHSGVEDPGNEANIAGCTNSEMPRGKDLQIIGTHYLRDLQIKNVHTLVLFSGGKLTIRMVHVHIVPHFHS